MPFGLSNSPAVFQALVNDTLRDMLNRFVFVYLDEILIFSKTLLEHILHVRQVLRCLLQSQLYVKIQKHEFHISQVSFLGHIISTAGIQMDPVKIEAAADWSPAISLKQVQRFLRFAYFYRHFTHNFGAVAAPLKVLTRKSQTRFRWTPRLKGH